MNYRLVALRTADGTEVQIPLSEVLRVASEHASSSPTAMSAPTIAESAPIQVAAAAPPPGTLTARQGAESLCAAANIGTHVVQLSEDAYAVPIGLAEIKVLIGDEAFTRALAAGFLVCPLGTVDRGSISEDEITGWSKMPNKLLVGGDALSDLRVIAELNKALAARGLSARLATKEEGEKTGRELRSRGVKMHPSYYGWFRTLDKDGKPVLDLKPALEANELKARLGYFIIDYDDWIVGNSPLSRNDCGGLVAVVSKAK